MKVAKIENRDLVVDILIQSFDNNDSVNFIVKQDHRRKLRVKALMEYSFDVCLKYGKVYLSDDDIGCALILYPYLKKSILDVIWLDVKLVFNSIGILRVIKALRRENLIKSRYPSHPFLYLWFIGVKIDEQHKGIGSVLLQNVIDESKNKNLDILLETSTIANISWYEKFNFLVYDSIFFNYKLFMLRRIV